jgi:hypothetical protein
MSLSVAPRFLGLLPVLVLVFAAASCDNRSVIGQQTGMAGTGGGGGGVLSGQAGRGGTTGSAGSSGLICDGFAGAGGGDFRVLPASFHAIHRNSFAVAVGDLNGDGRPDLAVANNETQDVVGGAGDTSGGGGAGGSDFETRSSTSVLLSVGNTGYGAPQHYPGGARPRSIDLGDLNSDGKIDLAVGGPKDVRVLFNGGDGTMLPPVTFVTTGFSSAAVGDLNGDGKSDFVATNTATSTVSVFLNMGSGTFVVASYASVPSADALALADVDGDSRADIVVVGGDGVGVLHNDGGGSFTSPARFGMGTNAQSVAVGDLNGDGTPDLAVAGLTGVSVMLNLGNGVFAAAITYGDGFESVVIGDLNGDGRPDLAGAVKGDGRCRAVAVLPNVGNAVFGPPTYLPVGPNEGRYWFAHIALADMNADGALDVVVPTADGVVVLTNTAH